MDATLQADLQGVADKDQASFSVKLPDVPEVVAVPAVVGETVDFTPNS